MTSRHSLPSLPAHARKSLAPRSDVKPENLLCSRRGGIDRVKLADFGSAMLLPPEGSAAVDPVAQGTTLYSPPEVLLGKTYSYAADMWATGITSCAAPPPRTLPPPPSVPRHRHPAACPPKARAAAA